MRFMRLLERCLRFTRHSEPDFWSQFIKKLAVEFSMRSIPFEREKPLELYYKEVRLEKKYVPDFVCFGQIILELKVLPKLTNIEVAQLINYLKITKMRLGLLANFGSLPRLEWNRYVL